MIKIGIPYIKRENSKSRLCSCIQIDKNEYEIYYEVESKYEEFLCFERADSFIVALLHFAMDKGQDIISEAPISEKLYYQLSSYLIPTLAKYIYNEKIRIIANSDTISITRGNAVGTGLSSGVDSFHAISTHIDLQTPKYNISYLTFLNVGSHGVGEKGHSLYKARLNRARELSKALGFELVEVNSNISDLVNMNFAKTHTFRSFSAILALQKLFNTYYYASGYPISEFNVSKTATSANYDLLSVYLLSTEELNFYSIGIETSRLEKVQQVASYKQSHKYLNVCTKEDINCGICEKCIRTQLELYSIGKLGLYKEVFDLNKFNSHLSSHLGYMLANQNREYYREIKNSMKVNNIMIPTKSYTYALKFKLINILKKSKSFSYIRGISRRNK